MQQTGVSPSDVTETPGSIAYSELVYKESGRLADYLFFLLDDPEAAKETALSSFEYVWNAFRRGEIIGDAEDQLYRHATRAAFKTVRKTGARGFLPPTTAPDKEIVASGVVSGFDLQQRAAILLAAVTGV